MLRDTVASPRFPLYLLRAALLASCTAYVVWMTNIDETPLLSWMWSPADVGGLDWGEQTGYRVQRGVAVVLGLAALALLWRPFPLALAAIALFQVLWAFAMSQ